MKTSNLITVILFFAAISPARAQTDTLLLYHHTKALDDYADKNPIEKVHLHLDRPWYGLGDTIWFKAYTVVGDRHRLSALSGVLYAELISPSDSIIQRLTLRLTSGTASGSLVIPYTYKPGDYRIRAYTNWMRNDDPAYFFNKKINIGGVDPKAAATANAAANSSLPDAHQSLIRSNAIDVQFFPEGGYLVNGLRSKVAFKAVNNNGLAADIHGVIVDNENNEVAVFSTQHSGMGQFPLLPQVGKSYRAKITSSDSSHFDVVLPRAMDSGFTLKLNNTKDSIYAEVSANPQLFQSHTDTAFYLIGQSGGRAYFTTGSKLVSRVFSVTIPASSFPTGIAGFTLFSQSGEPLNERVVFIQNKDRLNLTAKTDKESYSPKDHVVVDLSADSAVTGSFSVAVTDETRVPVDEQNEATIFTDLLLKSELKGDIASPNYYFMNTDDKTRSDLDLLMLTQGFRRFEWKKILDNVKEKQIEGLVKDLNGKPMAGTKVDLLSLTNNLKSDTLTDKNGRFVFDDVDVADSSRLFIKVKDKQPQPFNIYVLKNNLPGNTPGDNAVSDTAKQISESTGQPLSAKPATAANNKKSKVLKEVVIKSTKHEKPDARNKYGTDDSYTIPGERLKDFASVGTGLLSTVPGLIIDGHGNYATSIKLPDKMMYVYVPVSVVVDNHLIDPQNINEEVNADDIYNVKIVSHDNYTAKAIYGISNGAEGDILVITTKRFLGIRTPSRVTKDTTLNNQYFTTTVKPAAGLVYTFNSDKTDSVAFMPEQDLSLSGNIKTLAGKPVVNGRIKLTSVKDLFATDTISDANGNFTFTGIDLNDSTKVVIDAKKAKGGNNVAIRIHEPDVPPVDKSSVVTFNYSGELSSSAVLAAQQQSYIVGQQKASKNSIQLKEVVIKSHRNTYFNPVYSDNMKFSSNLNGPGNANEVILSDKLMRSGSGLLSEILVGKTFLMSFKGGLAYNNRNGKVVSVFVEGAQISPGAMDDINPNDIYSIEILTSATYLSIYGSNAPGGALIITLKHGTEKDTTKVAINGLITYTFKGFYKAREFYSPRYLPNTTTAATDDRTTIYWNPNVITDKTGKATFNYFNAGYPGTYRVVVEGIDTDGNLARKVFWYKVE